MRPRSWRKDVRSSWNRCLASVIRFADVYMNYFRVHMLYFVFMTLFWSAIMYASNPKDHYVPYTDCLFLCASAVTVTGLVTVPVSQLTLWQQIILFCLASCGNLVIVSTTTVLVRRHWFAKRFHKELERSFTLRKQVEDVHAREVEERTQEIKRLRRFFHLRTQDSMQDHRRQPFTSRKHPPHKLHAGMVHRVQGPAVQVNPTGQHTTRVDHVEVPESAGATGILSGSTAPESAASALHGRLDAGKLFRSSSLRHSIDDLFRARPLTKSATHGGLDDGQPMKRRRFSFNDMSSRYHKASDVASGARLPRVQTVDPASIHHDTLSLKASHVRPAMRMPQHAHTWAFGDASEKHLHTDMSDDENDDDNDDDTRGPKDLRSLPGHALHRTMTQKRDTGLGGFPNVIDFAVSLVESSHLRQRMHVPTVRTMTTMQPALSGDDSARDTRFAPYLTFDATVTGNSHFRNLTSAQRRELGGVEYRALNLLAWLIPVYWLTIVCITIVFTAPYLASGPGAQYREALQKQPKPPHNSTWFWIFQTVSSITNLGMSLRDDSLTGTMSKAYMVLIPQMILIVIGNTGFPVMLRFVIWCMSRCVSRRSKMYETLMFLLDHPRRCFLYLFPSQNTWLLFAVLLILTLVDWFLLMICDLNLRHDFASNGTWVLASLFQSVSTRSSGFQTFTVSQLSPAEQLLEVLMMYIAAFPLMMTMRSTNVYEDRSLFVEETNEDAKSEKLEPDSQAIWGRFLGTHIRNQLAYDLWWVMLALWVVLLCEKGKIDSAEFSNMSVFGIIYELMSAYGTVGMSYGATSKSASLAGDMSVLSKLVITAVMIRGRHRNLPSAVDRAVMLPHDLHHHDNVQDVKRHDSVDSMNKVPSRTSSVHEQATDTPAPTSEAGIPPRLHTHFVDEPIIMNDGPTVESPKSM